MELEVCLEVFKDIPGYEGLYQVSNLGRVKSLGNNKGKKEKIKTPIKTTDGYYDIGLHKNKVKKMVKVHKLVAEVFLSNPDNMPYVTHKDGDRKNNRVDNLEYTNHSNLTYEFKHLTKDELFTLQGVLNEEILSMLESGDGLKDYRVVIMRGLLKKLGLKEYYQFDKYDVED